MVGGLLVVLMLVLVEQPMGREGGQTVVRPPQMLVPQLMVQHHLDSVRRLKVQPCQVVGVVGYCFLNVESIRGQ
ncbi:UNVERIFIED_CONTAM: hypothetical protein Slati_0146100 [Sesamum latifolium]|uniref:Secreted protein n=1 Tax=Sesamum latifolium TaxID=2727402 RepID=A0AAW2YAU7_9LAMI